MAFAWNIEHFSGNISKKDSKYLGNNIIVILEILNAVM